MSTIAHNSLKPRRMYRTPWKEAYNVPVYPKIFTLADYDHQEKVTQQKNPRKTTKENKSVRSLLKNLEEYFFNSTLHGLRYVGDQSVSVVERLFWFCSFISAVCFAIYFITNIFEKYNRNPIIESLNPTPTSLESIPFPAITICNANQAKRTEAESIMQSGTDAEKVMLDNYCGMNVSSVNISTVVEEATKWENIKDFIFRVNPSCEEMLRVCIWKREEMSCDFSFNNALTDDGLCCTFNALPSGYIFRNLKDIAGLNLTYPPNVDDWNPERGYAKNVTIDALPRRAAGSGAHLGLTVVVDVQRRLYFCSATASVGFMVQLHNPLETPKMADYALLVSPGVEARIVVEPKIFEATPQVQGISIDKRLCYFTHERSLQFYRTYTKLNCQLECQANYTLLICDCVPYFLPKDKYTNICGKATESCVEEATKSMELANLEGPSCGCLPACFELGYEATATYGKLSTVFKMNEEIIKNESPEYFVTDMAVLHFYFVNAQFTSNTKSVLYGFSEFLSNTGGLLGLFMGFSFLSAVEVGYFLSLRILCKVVRSKRKHNRKRSKDNPEIVYPFAQ